MKQNTTIKLILSVMAVLFVTKTDGREQYKAAYDIYRNNQKIYADRIEVTISDEYAEYVDNIDIAGEQPVKRHLEMAYENGSFKYYHQLTNGIPEFRAVTNNNLVSFYEKESMVGALPVEGVVYTFEPTAYSHYSMLLDLVNRKKPSEIQMEMVIPLLQDFLPVKISRHGTDHIQTSGGEVEAHHFRVVVGKKEIANFWADGNRVLAIYLNSQNSYIVISGDDRLYESVKRAVNRAS